MDSVGDLKAVSGYDPCMARELVQCILVRNKHFRPSPHSEHAWSYEGQKRPQEPSGRVGLSSILAQGERDMQRRKEVDTVSQKHKFGNMFLSTYVHIYVQFLLSVKKCHFI